MNSENQSAYELWKFFESSLQNTIEKNVPSKMTSNKASLPWITYAKKKLIRKRDRAYSPILNRSAGTVRFFLEKIQHGTFI